MTLGSINKVLRKFGLVLVATIDDAGPTRLSLVRAKTFDVRAKVTT